jgi:hypothetical protein
MSGACQAYIETLVASGIEVEANSKSAMLTPITAVSKSLEDGFDNSRLSLALPPHGLHGQVKILDPIPLLVTQTIAPPW